MGVGMYGKKRKPRTVDPNAPPRPTLLGHEKTIKDANEKIDRQEIEIQMLKTRVDTLERKMLNLASEYSYLRQLLQGRR